VTHAPHDERYPTAGWSEFLAAELDCPVTVVFTCARKTPLRVRPYRTGARLARTSALEVRMHAMFDAAPPDVRRAVASWIRSGKRAPRAGRLLDDWIQESLARLPAPRERNGTLRTRGHHYDLAALLADVLATDFAGEQTLRARPPRITWGRRAPSKSRGGLRLGSYDADLHRVRVHPVLDQPAVPEWVVRYIVFHEVLHALLPPVKGADGCWIHHGREFRAREKRYGDYRRVLTWEKQHLRAPVRSARSATPIPLENELHARPLAAHSSPARPSPPTERAEGLLPRAARMLQRLLFE
jgi:hypothetical protein